MKVLQFSSISGFTFIFILFNFQFLMFFIFPVFKFPLSKFYIQFSLVFNFRFPSIANFFNFQIFLTFDCQFCQFTNLNLPCTSKFRFQAPLLLNCQIQFLFHNLKFIYNFQFSIIIIFFLFHFSNLHYSSIIRFHIPLLQFPVFNFYFPFSQFSIYFQFLVYNCHFLKFQDFRF